MKAIIFNSGIGKRMGEFTQKHPKALTVLKNGETIFERQIRLLNQSGINEFIITTGPFQEQFEEIIKKFSDLKFTLVHNPKYQETNYIYSMYLAREYLDDDVLLLHGDLVFDEDLPVMMLNDSRPSLALINETKPLPEKDFKGRVANGYLKEVAINIFGSNCYAFQPFYKLEKDILKKWLVEVEKFVLEGNTGVYAENALNGILDTLNIAVTSYRNNYIEEIDNMEDYERVANEIENFRKPKCKRLDNK